MKYSSEKGHFDQPAPPKISLQSPFLCVHGLNTCVRAEGWGRAAQRRGLCASETRPVRSETSFRLGLLALDAPFPDCLLLRTEPPSYCPFAETLCASESVSSGLSGALNCARSHARVISYMVRKYSGDRLHLPGDACRTSRLPATPASHARAQLPLAPVRRRSVDASEQVFGLQTERQMHRRLKGPGASRVLKMTSHRLQHGQMHGIEKSKVERRVTQSPSSQCSKALGNDLRLVRRILALFRIRFRANGPRE